MSKIKEFSWEEHLKDPSKTYYRCGEKPKKVWINDCGEVMSESDFGSDAYHESNGSFMSIVFPDYDLVIHQ